MIDDFERMGLVGRGDCWEVRRDAENGLVAVRLTGAIDDGGSAAWRDAVASADPRALFIDATGSTAATSLSSRAALAMFIRTLVARDVRVEVVANEHMSVVCRTVMRLAGAQNVMLIKRQEAPQALRQAITAAVTPLRSAPIATPPRPSP
jgi:hypothetical protein